MKDALIRCPSKDLCIDMFVDADFASLWPHKNNLDLTCIKSRTRFVICIANCPIIWQSKLQSKIATSTTETEYIALSQAMHSVLPFLDVAKTLKNYIGLKHNKTTFKVRVWGDNSACHTLANLEPGRTTPRTKHYAIKLHWFCSKLELHNIKIEKISTDQQRADIFTKGLQKNKFPAIRKLLCGW